MNREFQESEPSVKTLFYMFTHIYTKNAQTFDVASFVSQGSGLPNSSKSTQKPTPTNVSVTSLTRRIILEIVQISEKQVELITPYLYMYCASLGAYRERRL